MLADGFVILISLLLVATALTQILAPLIQNRPLFYSFRESYQREKYLMQQLEEAKRRLAELELEKELAEHRGEVTRRQLEQIGQFYGFDAVPPKASELDVNRQTDISEEER